MSLLNGLERSHWLEKTVVEAEGDLPAEIDHFLFELSLERAEDVDQTHLIRAHVKSTAKHFREQAERLFKVARGLETVDEKLTGFLKEAILSSEQLDLFGRDYRFKLCPLPDKVKVLDQDLLPEEFFEQVKIIKKDALREALLGGKAIPGAELEPVYALRSYVNRRGLQ